MSSNDVTITEDEYGDYMTLKQPGRDPLIIPKRSVAALRAHFAAEIDDPNHAYVIGYRKALDDVAERMPEDVRELLTLARNARDAHERPNGDGDWYLYRQAVAWSGGPERVLAALEAAYSQKGAES